MAAVLSMTIISCGGSEGEGEEVVTGVVTNTSNNTSTSVSEVGSARVATTESQFKSYVQKGQFVATQFGNTFYNSGYYGQQPTGVVFNLVTVTCYTEVSNSDFLWWDDVFTTVDQDCNQTNVNQRVEYKDGRIQHEYGSSKQSILNQFMNIINNAESFKLASSSYYYGGQTSSSRAYAVKDGKTYLFDLSKPILANPVLVEDERAYQSNGQVQEGDTEVIYFAGQQDIYNN